MSALYQISENHKELTKLVNNHELTIDQVADTFESIEGEFNDKAVSLIAVKQNIQSKVDAIGKEIDRLKSIKETMENKQKNMTEYLRTNMEATGINKIESLEKPPFFSITLCKSRDVVDIYDEGKIPVDYLDIRTSMKPMKKEILEALKNGEEVKGAVIGKSKRSLKIK